MFNTNNQSGPIILCNAPISFTFPLGIAYLAGYLKQHQENVKIIFWPENPDENSDFAKKIISMNPLVVGFGGLYPDLYQVKEIIYHLNKTGRNFPIVIGGQMVSPIPEFALNITGADYGVIGEGEIIFYNLIQTIRNRSNPMDVGGLALRINDTIQTTGPGPYIKNLSQLPRIPFDLFGRTNDWIHMGRAYLNYFQPQWHYGDRIVPIHGARGCPFTCNFCYHHSSPRYRKIEKLKEDIEEAVEKHGATLLDISDDTVIHSEKRAIELIETMRSLKRPVEYYLSCRFDTLEKLNDEILQELKKTGCRIIGPGLESGSQKILDTIGKKITVDQIISGLRRLKDANIMTTTAIQIGQLDETIQDAEASLQLMTEALRYDKHLALAFSITTPFPGSALYKLAFEKGLLKSHHDFFDRCKPTNSLGTITVNLSQMTNTELLMMFEKMHKTYRSLKFSSMSKNTFHLLINRERLQLVHKKITFKLWKFLPKHKLFDFLKKTYENTYHIIQTFLDFLWRKTWGA